jgi:hypothetical protein
MIQDTLIIIFLFGISLSYMPQMTNVIIIGYIFYIIYIKFIHNKSIIYENINEIVRPNKKQEYIDKNTLIKNISKYEKYDIKSFNKGVSLFKKYDKYLNKLIDKEDYINNKGILENCIYYLNESKDNFLMIKYSINNIDITNDLDKNIIDYYDYYNKELFDKIHELNLKKELYNL